MSGWVVSWKSDPEELDEEFLKSVPKLVTAEPNPLLTLLQFRLGKGF